MEITLKPTRKQHDAYQFLFDDVTKYIVFGGGAGGGKTWLGSEWLMKQCIQYPGTRWFLGRKKLKTLKQTTLQTFFEVCQHHDLEQDNHYKYKEKDGEIHFDNGSVIYLLELKYKPSDPNYQAYGSSEFTGGWIEEGGEVHFKAFDVLKSRIGRKKNDEYDLAPKMLITCNPSQNWLYREFYKPWKNKKLPEEKAFVQSLVGDNPHQESSYEDQLRSISDQRTKERLLFGNWEYDENPNKLVDYDASVDLFTSSVPHSRNKYLTLDLASWGQDKIVFMVWRGWDCYKIEVKDRQGIDTTREELIDMLEFEDIPYSHCGIDAGGLSGLTDDLRGTKPYIANGRPLADPESSKTKKSSRQEQRRIYKNLKAQCGYKLAKKINNHEVAISADISEDLKERIISELGVLRSEDVNMDSKKKLIKKEDMKEMLGHSPDFLDAMLIRQMLELNPKSGKRKAKVYNPYDKKNKVKVYNPYSN